MTDPIRDNPYFGLHGSARRCFVREDLMDVTTRDHLREAREVVRAAVDGGLATQAELAHRSGVPRSSISEFLNDTWKGEIIKLCEYASRLTRTIDQLARELDAGRTGIGGFVMVRAAQAIYDLAQLIMDNRQMGCFVMNAGCGKTMTLAALAQVKPGAVMVTVRSTAASPKSFLQTWASDLFLNPKGRSKDTQDRIIQCLRGSSRLQLIDEAHKLPRETLNVIREVWDAARCPILFAATPVFTQTLTVSQPDTLGAELMDQLYSRVGVYRDLRTLENPDTGVPEKLFTVADIRKVFCRGRIRVSRDGLDFLAKVANARAGGGLRACCAMVILVHTGSPGVEMTAEMLRGTLRARLGSANAELLFDSIRADEGLPLSATA